MRLAAGVTSKRITEVTLRLGGCTTQSWLGSPPREPPQAEPRSPQLWTVAMTWRSLLAELHEHDVVRLDG